MATYTRQNVWDAGGADGWGGPVIWLARGVKAMKAAGVDVLNNRTGWRFFACMHGFSAQYWPLRGGWYTKGEAMPDGTDKDVFWNQCQHGSWYFLPWHRGYLMALENVLRSHIVKLGGPADWALPYWNYFKTNQADLPIAFAKNEWPDGGDNPLYVVNRYGPNDPGGKGGGKVYVEIGPPNGTDQNALGDDLFISPDPDDSATEFGGIQTGFEPSGGNHGGIESAPHDDVHVFVGGGGNARPPYGLMTWPPTAALDPIFYLHHANIDRLWEVWKSDPAHTDPTNEPDWMGGPTHADPTSRAFVMPRPDNTAWTYTPGDVHDLSQLDYSYDDLAPAGVVSAPQARLAALGIAAPTARPTATREGTLAMAAAPKTSELMGATGALRISGTEATASLPIDTAARTRLTASFAAAAQTAKPDRVFLRLENIKTDHDGIPLTVYLGLPDGTEHRAGLVTLFGASQASQADGDHAGNGMTKVMEVSRIIDQLHARDALKAGTLRVRVVPRHAVPASADLSIGRISLYRRPG